MKVIVGRNIPMEFTTEDLEGVEELEEHLKDFEGFNPLTDTEKVTVEITAPWRQIEDLLALPFFSSIWQDPQKKQ